MDPGLAALGFRGKLNCSASPSRRWKIRSKKYGGNPVTWFGPFQLWAICEQSTLIKHWRFSPLLKWEISLRLASETCGNSSLILHSFQTPWHLKTLGSELVCSYLCEHKVPRLKGWGHLAGSLPQLMQDPDEKTLQFQFFNTPQY
jgi:hypothetical protein